MNEVILLRVDGNELDIVESARVSYKTTVGESMTAGDVKLLRYLMRRRHTTPFEQVSLRFRLQMPIFVARQHIRHRTAKLNEASARYRPMLDKRYEVTEWRGQDTVNKQGSQGTVEYVSADQGMAAFEEYHRRIAAGVSLELARKDLPLSAYTEMIWMMDLHNLFHYLKLRMDSHAQLEIRDLANKIAEHVKRNFPNAWTAFEDYHLCAVTLSRLDIEYINGNDLFDSKNERAECLEKLNAIGWNQ